MKRRGEGEGEQGALEMKKCKKISHVHGICCARSSIPSNPERSGVFYESARSNLREKRPRLSLCGAPPPPPKQTQTSVSILPTYVPSTCSLVSPLFSLFHQT